MFRLPVPVLRACERITYRDWRQIPALLHEVFLLQALTDLVHSIPDSPALCKFPFLRARAVWWVLGLLLVGLLLIPSHVAAAQDAPPNDRVSANATLFIGPRARTRARLDALRVDATIQQEDARTWAAVQSWFRLQNTLTSTLSLDAIVQGMDTTPAATAVTLTVDSAPQLLTTLDGTNHWLWQASIPGSGRLEPLLTYRVPLGEGALARFRYDLVNGWGRAPGSLRVTLRFPDGLAPDQLLWARPAGYTFDGNQLTWSYDNPAQLASLDLLILTSTAWRALQTAQTAAAAPAATAADHLALGRWYHRLALADAGEGVSLFDRYYPQAMAALAQAAQLAPNDPAPARLLADLYGQKATRASSSTTYRALAAGTLAKARAQGDNSPELQASLARLSIDLARAAQSNGSWRGAAQYLAQLDSLDAHALPAEQLDIVRAIALAQAQESLARGDMIGARAVIESAWDSSVLAVPGAPVASFLSQQAAVSLSAHQYAIDLTLAPRPAVRAIAQSSLQRAVADAQTVPGIVATLAERDDLFQLTVTMPFGSPRELREKRTHLAGLVASEADLALLHALLTVRDLDVVNKTETFWQTQQLTDTLDLPAAHRTWTGHAARYQQAVDALHGTAATDPAAGLIPIRRALWQAEGAAWQDLAAHSEVRYRATLTRVHGLDQAKTWASGLAAPLAVQLHVADWRVEVLLAAGVVLLSIVTLMAWLFWRFA